MKNLKDTLLTVGFSEELIDAINEIPVLESQEMGIANHFYQIYKCGITSSTEINISGNPNLYNYFGDDDKQTNKRL